MNDPEYNIPFHELAECFELLEGEAFEKLIQDIRENGLLDPITLFQSEILDGRNRYRACLAADVEPHFIAFGVKEEYEDFPFPLTFLGTLERPGAYVESKNFHRRHSTVGQRAAAGVKIKEYYAKMAKEKMAEITPKNLPQVVDNKEAAPITVNLPELGKTPAKKEPDARTKAGQDIGVSGKSIDMAEAVLKSGDEETIKGLKSGKLTLNQAHKKVTKPKTSKSKKPKAPKPDPAVKLKEELAEQQELIDDLRSSVHELTEELQSQADASADEQEQAKQFMRLRERIRVLESQVKEWQHQCAQWKKEALALRKKLGRD